MALVQVESADLAELASLAEVSMQKEAAAVAAAKKVPAVEAGLDALTKAAADSLVQHGHIPATDKAMAITQLAKHANALQTIATLAARHPKSEEPQTLGTPVTTTTTKSASAEKPAKTVPARKSDQDFLNRVRNG